MRFLDRQEELKRLEALYRRKGGGLALLWGRRRVGKTRLLLEWCGRHGGLYTVADQSAEPVQRRYFASAAAAVFPGFGEVEYPNWRTLLEALAREARAHSFRGPIVFDELPNLVASSPTLPSVLQIFIDQEAKQAGLVVALAGSAQHMMQGLALSSDAPLYGRAIEILPIAPLSVGFIGSGLRLKDPVAQLAAYAVWGGVPRYWELAAPFGPHLAGAVDELVLNPLGVLHAELDRLLAEDLPSAMGLRPLLDVIGCGAHRVSEIAGRLSLPATSLARPLSRLVQLGYVAREQPFGVSEKGGKRALYRLGDPFLRLWFTLVAPRRGLLASAPRATRRHLFESHKLGLFAEQWEALCRGVVPLLDPGLLAGRSSTPRFGPAARFWGPGLPEWDVVAESLDRRTLLVGEAKWHGGEATQEAVRREIDALLRKGDPPIPGARHEKVIRVLFVPRVSPGIAGKPWPVKIVDGRTILAAFS